MDPVDFCLNCAREGHRTVDCDHVVDPRFGRTGRCKVYLGHLNGQLTDEELEDHLRCVIGLDFCLTVVVKNNKTNNGRFAFVELELPLPLEAELEELWMKLEDQGLARKMSLKAVGPENLVPSEEWGRPMRVSVGDYWGGLIGAG